MLQEQIYLKSYIFYSRQEYTSIENLIAQYLVKHPNKELGFKLTYTRLLALVNQEKHFQADEILRTFLPKTTYTPNYAEFIELAGVINFGLKRYKKSLKDYSEGIRLRPNQKVTPLLMLKKAWLEYILTNYLPAKLTVSNIPEKMVGLLSDELRYLKFLIYLKIEDWPNVVQSFSVFKLNSDWYQYVAYLMNLNRQYLSNYPSLLNDLLNVSYQVPDHGIHVALKEGNDWFEKNNFKESEKFFLITLALEPNGQVYDQIRFNLAMNYIKTWHWCTNRHFDKNIAGLLFFYHFHLKIWLSWHLAQQGKVQVVIK